MHQTVHELASVLQADEFTEFRRTEVEVAIPGLGFQLVCALARK